MFNQVFPPSRADAFWIFQSLWGWHISKSEQAVEDALNAGHEKFASRDRDDVKKARQAVRLDPSLAKDILSDTARRGFMGFISRSRNKPNRLEAAKELKALVYFSNLVVTPLLQDINVIPNSPIPFLPLYCRLLQTCLKVTKSWLSFPFEIPCPLRQASDILFWSLSLTWSVNCVHVHWICQGVILFIKRKKRQSWNMKRQCQALMCSNWRHGILCGEQHQIGWKILRE